MSLRIPYNQLPNLGALESGDIIPGLRPAFNEGSMTVGDLTNFVNTGKVYRVNMSQLGTSDPIVNYEYENRIGTIVWSYQSIGVYYGVLAGAFTLPANKTNTFFSATLGASIGYYTIERIDDNTIELRVKDKNYINIDGALDNTFIEIIAYYLAP
jgi:hypothetical protein